MNNKKGNEWPRAIPNNEEVANENHVAEDEEEIIIVAAENQSLKLENIQQNLLRLIHESENGKVLLSLLNEKFQLAYISMPSPVYQKFGYDTWKDFIKSCPLLFIQKDDNAEFVCSHLYDIESKILVLIDANVDKNLIFSKLTSLVQASSIDYKSLGYEKLEGLVDQFPSITVLDQCGSVFCLERTSNDTKSKMEKSETEDALAILSQDRNQDLEFFPAELCALESQILRLIDATDSKEIHLCNLPLVYKIAYSTPLYFRDFGYEKLEDLISQLPSLLITEKDNFTYVRIASTSQKGTFPPIRSINNDEETWSEVDETGSVDDNKDDLSKLISSDSIDSSQKVGVCKGATNTVNEGNLAEQSDNPINSVKEVWDLVDGSNAKGEEISSYRSRLVPLVDASSDRKDDVAHDNNSAANAATSNSRIVAESSPQDEDLAALKCFLHMLVANFDKKSMPKSSKQLKRFLISIEHKAPQTLKIWLSAKKGQENANSYIITKLRQIKVLEGENKNYSWNQKKLSRLLEENQNDQQIVMKVKTRTTQTRDTLIERVTRELTGANIHKRILKYLEDNPNGVTCNRILRGVRGLSYLLADYANQAERDSISPVQFLKNCQGVRAKKHVGGPNLFFRDTSWSYNEHEEGGFKTDRHASLEQAPFGKHEPFPEDPEMPALDWFLRELVNKYGVRSLPKTSKQLTSFIFYIEIKAPPVFMNWLDVTFGSDDKTKHEKAISHIIAKLIEWNVLDKESNCLYWDEDQLSRNLDQLSRNVDQLSRNLEEHEIDRYVREISARRYRESFVALAVRLALDLTGTELHGRILKYLEDNNSNGVIINKVLKDVPSLFQFIKFNRQQAKPFFISSAQLLRNVNGVRAELDSQGHELFFRDSSWSREDNITTSESEGCPPLSQVTGTVCFLALLQERYQNNPLPTTEKELKSVFFRAKKSNNYSKMKTWLYSNFLDESSLTERRNTAIKLIIANLQSLGILDVSNNEFTWNREKVNDNSALAHIQSKQAQTANNESTFAAGRNATVVDVDTATTETENVSSTREEVVNDGLPTSKEVWLDEVVHCFLEILHGQYHSKPFPKNKSILKEILITSIITNSIIGDWFRDSSGRPATKNHTAAVNQIMERLRAMKIVSGPDKNLTWNHHKRF